MKRILLLLIVLSNATLLFSQAVFNVTPGTTVKSMNGAHIVLNNMSFLNNGTTQQSQNDGTIKFIGSTNDSISGNGTTIIDRLNLSKDPGSLLILKSGISVNSEFIFTSGLLDLDNYSLDLGGNGVLTNESEISRSITTGAGYIQATRLLNNPSAFNAGNLGAVISSSANLGNTIIRRGHNVQQNVYGSNHSIQRYYDILPENNSNSNATLRLNYFNAELNGINKTDLSLWESTDNINWTSIGYTNRDNTNNYIEKSGVNDFSRWTLSNEILLLPSITSFTPINGFTGTTVTIAGTNFTGATSVTIGGTNVITYTVNNDTTITAVAGVGASGEISVTTPDGTGSSATNFMYNGYITAGDGDWNNSATWVGGQVPTSGANVTVNHIVTISSSLTNTGNIAVNGSLLLATDFANNGTVTLNGTFQLNEGGVATGNSFVYGSASTLAYAGSTAQTTSDVEFPAVNGPKNLTINNTVVYLHDDRTINGILDLGYHALEVNGHVLTLSGTEIKGPDSSSTDIGSLGGNSIPGSALVFTNTTPLTIQAGLSISVNDVNINTASIVQLSPASSTNPATSMQVMNLLTLTNGVFKLNGGSLGLNGLCVARTAGVMDASGDASNIDFNVEEFEKVTLPAGLFSRAINVLSISGYGELLLSENISISTALGTSAGFITTGPNKVTLLPGATADNVSGGFINGNLQRTVVDGDNEFPVGTTIYTPDLIPVFTPTIITMNGVSGSVELTVHSTFGEPAAGSGIDPAAKCDHYWTITKTGAGTFSSYDITADFTGTGNTGNMGNYILKKYDGSWAGTSSSVTDNTITATGLSSFGDFAVGEPGCIVPSISSQPLSTQTICQGITPNDLTVSATGDGLTYQWYSNTTNSTSGAINLYPAGSNSTFTPSITASGTLFYYCIVTGTCGTAVSDFSKVVINSLQTVSAGIYGPYSVSGPAVILTGSPAGGNFSGVGVTGNTFTPSAAGVGIHNIGYSYTDALTGCSNSASTNITVTCNFTADTITGPANACAYITTTGINATYSIAANGASSYNWTLPAGATLVSGTNTTSSILVHYANTFVSGTISVTVNSLCGNPITRTLLITKSIPAVPVAITGALNACPYIGTNTAVTYSIAPVAGAITYRWTLPPTVTLLSATPDSSSIAISFNTGFDIGANKSIRVKSISGCGSSADRILTISVTKPAVPGVITGATNACLYIGSSNTATYKTGLVANATSYTWTVPTGATITSHPNGLGAIDTVITVAFDNSFVSPSNISVQSVSGCGISTARTFAVSRTIPGTPGVISGPADACPLMGTANTATYTISKVANALFYNWSVPAGATANHPNGAGPNDTSIVVTYNNSFVSSAITVNAGNGCGNSANRSLTIAKNVPATPGVISGATNPCPFIGISDVTYTIRKVTNATFYTWTVPLGASISGHPGGPGINDTIITVTFTNAVTTGNISVIASNNCANSAARNLAIVRLLPATPGVITGPTDPCPFIAVAPVTYLIPKVANSTFYTWAVPAGATISSHPGGSGINDTIITVTFTSAITTGNISVIANNACASSATRTLAITRKLPAVPGTITATLLSASCPTRQYFYSIASLPLNATSVSWIPPVGGNIVSQGTLSVVIAYGPAAVAGNLKVVGVNNCTSSAERTLAVALAACPVGARLAGTPLAVQASPTKLGKKQEMSVQVFPNPTSSYYSLQFSSASNERAMMRVVDVLGRELSNKAVVANGVNKFGGELQRGVYFVEVVQGKQTKTIKVIKL